MDTLSLLVGSLHLANAIYTRFELGTPWGHRVTHTGQIKFVLVARGSCWLRTEALAEPLELQTNDLFLVLNGAPYSVSDRPTSRCIDCATLEPRRENFLIEYGGAGSRTTLVSVALQLAETDSRALVASLPPFIFLRLDETRSQGLSTMAELLRSEIAEELGSLPIVTRLAESLFISALRFHVQSEEAPKQGILAAIADPQIRRALHAMHEDIAEPWTLEELAARAGMSRASFAAKFRDKTGTPPLEYLTEQRIDRARALLREGIPIAEIAGRVGYESPVSFARAFRRVTGAPPGAFRRDARSEAAHSG